MKITTRLVRLDDAANLAELLRTNRDFLAPWEPTREEDYYTVAVQEALIEADLEQHEEGESLPHVILADDRIIGRITLRGIVRGPFQSSNLGYWVSSGENGRGVATTAVQMIIEVAFGALGLHRIQAGTLRHNAASQRVLERNGFTRFGLAPRYLKIAGRWQDHVLYQLLADDDR